MPLLFIHNVKNPRAIRGIDKKSLEVWYYHNKSAWMQQSIFASYLNQLNEIYRRKNRKIILLVNNVSSHKTNNLEQSNARVIFLPPNTTSQMQPLDQSIICSLKVINCLVRLITGRVFNHISLINMMRVLLVALQLQNSQFWMQLIFPFLLGIRCHLRL